MTLALTPHHGASGSVSGVALKTVIAEYTKMISELAHLTADLPQRLQIVDRPTGLEPHSPIKSLHSSISPMRHACEYSRGLQYLPQRLQMVDTDFPPGSEPPPTIMGRHPRTPRTLPVPSKPDAQMGEHGENDYDDVRNADINEDEGCATFRAQSQGTVPTLNLDRIDLDKRINEVILDTRTSRPSEYYPSDMYQLSMACCPCCFRRRSTRDQSGGPSSPNTRKTILPGAPRTEEHAGFDLMVGIVILANTLVLLIQLEYTGSKNSASLVDQEVRTDTTNTSTQIWLDVLEHVFNGFFVVEIVLRFVIFRTRLYDDPSLVFDFLVILSSSVQLYVLDQLKADSPIANISVLRMVRFLRVVRVLRLVRVLKMFSDLRVLVKTIIHSFNALLWSMVLLFLIMIMAGLLLCELLAEYIQTDTNELSMRKWVFKYYGTSTRAIYTLFEVTMAGCWPTYFRPLIHEVSGWFWLFAVLYVSLVVFAIIRIISALFLKETLQIAGHDAEMMAHERAKQKQAYIKKLRLLFEAVDVSGNGSLNLEEFQAIANNPHVKTWFQTLDVEIHDAEEVFRLLDDGDGEVTFDAFLKGLTRVRGQARAMDVVTIMHASDKAIEELGFVKVGLNDLLERADLPRLEDRLEGKLGVAA